MPRSIGSAWQSRAGLESAESVGYGAVGLRCIHSAPVIHYDPPRPDVVCRESRRFVSSGPGRNPWANGLVEVKLSPQPATLGYFWQTRAIMCGDSHGRARRREWWGRISISGNRAARSERFRSGKATGGGRGAGTSGSELVAVLLFDENTGKLSRSTTATANLRTRFWLSAVRPRDGGAPGGRCTKASACDQRLALPRRRIQLDPPESRGCREVVAQRSLAR